MSGRGAWRRAALPRWLKPLLFVLGLAPLARLFLLGYGDGFRYVEYSDYGAGPSGALTAGGVSVALGAGLAGFAFGPTRALLDRLLANSVQP